MNGNAHPILILELESADDETLAGRVSAARGTAVSFAGWLGLAGAIEAALRADVDDDPERTGGHGHD